MGENLQEHIDAGKQVFEGHFVKKFYDGPTKIGNEELLEKLSFSFRDPPEAGRQYKTQQLKFPETRFQQMDRFGMTEAGGLKPFDETPVDYQGNETMPWPGKEKWEDEEVFHKLEKHEFYDQEKGTSKPRGDDGGVYAADDPKVADWQKGSMMDDFKIILE